MSSRWVLWTIVASISFAGVMFLPAGAEELRWERASGPDVGARADSVLLYAADRKQMLLVGITEDALSVHFFDPVGQRWSELCRSALPAKNFCPSCQAAYDPSTKTIYCLSGGSVLHCFNVPRKTWKTLPSARALDGLSWHALACDTDRGRLVVVGADKKADNLGWSRTVVYDIRSGQWSRLDPGEAHATGIRAHLAAIETQTAELVGLARLAWFRDPRGVGTDAELKELIGRCEAIKKLPQAESFGDAWDEIAGQVAQGKTLGALKAARRVLRSVEEAAMAESPAPCARRNSPLAYDAANKVFVLFGGDHEDYLMNDTWVLDVEKRTWKRMRPELAPSPRAGHALFALPGGGVALYEGYVQTTSTDYGAPSWTPRQPIELWRYDPKANRWDLFGSWRLPGKAEHGRVPPVGHFDGYAAEFYWAPPISADETGRIVLAASPARLWFQPWTNFPSQTWILKPDLARPDPQGRTKLGTAPNTRLERGGAFAAAYCEVDDKPTTTGLDRLPDNCWVRLPEPPRNPCRGCRQRDWGTAVWDCDRDQILLWGGGHCVRSASVVAHYSPVGGRIVEGYDADEPYGTNGGGGFDSSLWNRPWISAHNYNHYAYDPKCRLMVSGRGYLYDPGRMDWLRMEPMAIPFEFDWGHTVVETSPHGAVAWAKRKGLDAYGLWQFDRAMGWTDLQPKGQLPAPYCDCHGMVYDSKRDRMVLSGVGGAYQKPSNGTLLAFDFKTRSITELVPANAELAKTINAREPAYIEHADWILLGEPVRQGGKDGRLYTRVYDVARNKMFLLDAGGFDSFSDPHEITYSTGWMYDSKRRLAYVFSFRGEAWVMKINPQTAELVADLGYGSQEKGITCERRIRKRGS